MRINKFGNVKTEIDGVVFASKKEAARYRQLSLLLKAKEITNLELQPRFKLIVSGQNICTYVADFQYECNGLKVVEDAKGYKTPVYKIKKKLMKAVHGIEVKEV